MNYSLYVGEIVSELHASFSKKVFSTSYLDEFKQLAELIGAEAELKFLRKKATGVITVGSRKFRDLTAAEIKAAGLPSMTKLIKAAKNASTIGVALLIEK